MLYSAGRQGATAGLGLEAIGVEADERGQIKVDEQYRTTVEGIYAVGDVIGFPALAATAMEQGRIAALSALGRPTEAMGELLPIGIYSIPEISFVGKTEEQLTEAGVPYEVGISRYRELARGEILGDSHGMLKLLVSLDDRTLLGVHVLGTGATELVHIGQVAMGSHATVDYLVGTVFNYPTLAEAYKVAALDAQNRLQALTDVGPLRSARPSRRRGTPHDRVDELGPGQRRHVAALGRASGTTSRGQALGEDLDDLADGAPRVGIADHERAGGERRILPRRAVSSFMTDVPLVRVLPQRLCEGRAAPRRASHPTFRHRASSRRRAVRRPASRRARRCGRSRPRAGRGSPPGTRHGSAGLKQPERDWARAAPGSDARSPSSRGGRERDRSRRRNGRRGRTGSPSLVADGEHELRLVGERLRRRRRARAWSRRSRRGSARARGSGRAEPR